MMKRFFKSTYFFLVILFLIGIGFSTPILHIFNPSYFGEQNNDFKPIHYLPGEFLSFEFCDTDGNPMKNISVVLSVGSNNFNINFYKEPNKNNCYFTNYDISRLDTSAFNLTIKYEIDGRIREVMRKFQREKESMLINDILMNSTNSTNNPMAVLAKLIVTDEIYGRNSENSQILYNELKNMRNNVNKCWPENRCNISMTSKILAYLSLEGYNQNSRLVSDGLFYLENNIISSNMSHFNYELLFKENKQELGNSSIACNLTVDNTSHYINFEAGNLDNKSEINISGSMNGYFHLLCNNTVDQLSFTVFNFDGRVRNKIVKNNGKEITYIIKPFSCVLKREDTAYCSFQNTLYGLIAYGDKFKEYGLMKDFINSYIETKKNFKYLNYNNTIYKYSAMYLFVNPDKSIINYLKYYQNNDGSWGSGNINNRIIPTAWSVLALSKVNVPSEYLDDAKKWIYYHEPTGGWGSYENNLLAYLAIKEKIKPFLLSNVFNTIDDSSVLYIKNPTIYHINSLSLNFGNLKNHLKYKEDLGDLNKNEGENITIGNKKDFFNDKFGFLMITGESMNKRFTFINFPVLLKAKKPYKLSTNNISISPNGTFKINFEKISNDTLTWNCKLSIFNITKNIKLFSLNNSFNLTTLGNNSKGYTNMGLSCASGKNKFDLNNLIYYHRIGKSFRVYPNFLRINSLDDFFVNVTNTYTDKIILNSKIEGTDYIVPAEREKIIAFNDTREVFFEFKNKNASIVNGTKGYLVLTAKGYTVKIPFEVSISNQNQRGSISLFTFIIVGVLIILVIFVVLIRLRNKIDSENQNSNQGGNNDEEELYVEEL